MSLNVILIAVAAAIVFLYKIAIATDKPKIKGIPEIPGWPVFGSLFELGNNHAKVAQGWARKYGPVFQVRMGNRVHLLKAAYQCGLSDTNARELNRGSFSPIRLSP